MNIFERTCIAVRHLPLFSKMEWLWAGLRPAYVWLLSNGGRNGLRRIINGTDEILVLPELRDVTEAYEPEVWKVVMRELKPGAKVVDVGAHMGVYAVAMAKRVGPSGRVYAAEPDPANREVLERQLRLNAVAEWVEIVPAAVGAEPGTARLHLQGLQSQVMRLESPSGEAGLQVPLTTVDQIVGHAGIDLMLVDVEGFELPVLQGASRLLADPARRPETIVIEVHPYAWSASGTTSDRFLECLQGAGYGVTNLAGETVAAIEWYGHVVARADGESRAAAPSVD